MVDDHRESNDTGPADAGAPHQPEPPQGDAVNERLRRGLFWALQYWRELFNFRFDKYMIIQVIPGVYGVALTASTTSYSGSGHDRRLNVPMSVPLNS